MSLRRSCDKYLIDLVNQIITWFVPFRTVYGSSTTLLQLLQKYLLPVVVVKSKFEIWMLNIKAVNEGTSCYDASADPCIQNMRNACFSGKKDCRRASVQGLEDSLCFWMHSHSDHRRGLEHSPCMKVSLGLLLWVNDFVHVSRLKGFMRMKSIRHYKFLIRLWTK